MILNKELWIICTGTKWVSQKVHWSISKKHLLSQIQESDLQNTYFLIHKHILWCAMELPLVP